MPPGAYEIVAADERDRQEIPSRDSEVLRWRDWCRLAATNPFACDGDDACHSIAPAHRSAWQRGRDA